MRAQLASLVSASLAAVGLSAFAVGQPPAQPQTTQNTQTSSSDSRSHAHARAEAHLVWSGDDDDMPAELRDFLTSLPVNPLAAKPTNAHHSAPNSRMETGQTWVDPRENPPRTAGFGVIAVATAKASAHSSSHANTNSTHGDAPGASNGTSNSKSTAKAEAHATIVVAPGARPASNEDRPPALRQPNRDRLEALSDLAKGVNASAGASRLGQTYLAHPDLLAAPISDDWPGFDTPQLRAALDGAIAAARAENLPGQWIAVSALSAADGRPGAAQFVLSKIDPRDLAVPADLERYAQALRAMNGPKPAK